jgi:2-dehydropantoate 2-reductase
MNRGEIQVQIMGAGAIGSLFGALIQLSGFKVYFVSRGKQLEALKSRGLTLKGIIKAHLRVNAESKPRNADLTIIAVKAYDTKRAAEILSEVEPGITLTIQNGVGNVEVLSKFLDRVVGGVTTYGANLVAPGIVNYAGEGMVFVGNDGFISDDARFVGEVLRAARVNCELVSDISFRIWSKAIVNSAINPITAICGVKNGKIIEIEELWEIASSVVEEGVSVLRKMGMTGEDLLNVVKDVVIKTSENRSSMLQDIENKKRTEIDFINGKIVEKAEELGLEANSNRILVNLIKGLERAYGIR